MYEESGNGGSAGRNALRSLRLAVWRLDDMGQEAEILARVRTVLALADIAYNHCQVYRIEDGRNGVSEPDAVRSDGAPRVIAHNLKADGLWRQLKEGGAGVRTAWQAANTCSRAPADAGEREHLIRQLYSEVGAILETSFDQGVLALYREDDVPFSATDAAWVEELGEVLSGLFYRLDDLQRLQDPRLHPGQRSEPWMFNEPLPARKARKPGLHFLPGLRTGMSARQHRHPAGDSRCRHP